MTATKRLSMSMLALRLDGHMKRMYLSGHDETSSSMPNVYCVPWFHNTLRVRYGPKAHNNDNLSRAEAERYLAWLEAGNSGKYSDMERKDGK